MSKKNVLMVGSSTNVKGGMTTVVNSFLKYKSSKYNLKYIATHKDFRNNSFKLFYFGLQFLKVIYYLIFKQVHIVHMHLSERGSFQRKYIIYKVARIFKKKVITHTHGAEFESYFNSSNNKNKNKIKELLSNSDAVIALGTNWENIIKKIEFNARTIILRNAVDLPSPFEKSYNNKKYSILFLAVLIERKGILDLIEAAKLISKQLNGNVEFVIAGDGELYEKSVKIVKSAGLETKFKFKGWVNEKEKNDLLRRADIFVLPSYNEGLPLAILEAMSFYLPIVSTNVGSIDEAVKNKENGILVQPGNIKELENAILDVLEPTNLMNYSKNSRQMAEEMFNNKEYFIKIEKLYASVTEG